MNRKKDEGGKFKIEISTHFTILSRDIPLNPYYIVRPLHESHVFRLDINESTA
jgi:hypothetical protein